MGLRFIGQPFAGSGQIGDVLAEALRTSGANELWLATAWAKQSGIQPDSARSRRLPRRRGRVGGDRRNRRRGRNARGVGDVSRPFRRGVRLSRPWHADVSPARSTPSETADRATVVVGSGNLTKGGLFTNYEAAFVLDAERDTDDWALRDEVRAYFDALLGAGKAIRAGPRALVVRPLERDRLRALRRRSPTPYLCLGANHAEEVVQLVQDGGWKPPFKLPPVKRRGVPGARRLLSRYPSALAPASRRDRPRPRTARHPSRLLPSLHGRWLQRPGWYRC